jgi:hypothetical protein
MIRVAKRPGVVAMTLTDCGSTDWPLYIARAAADAPVLLDAEHDRFEWVPVDRVAARCAPALVQAPLAAVAQCLSALPGDAFNDDQRVEHPVITPSDDAWQGRGPAARLAGR